MLIKEVKDMVAALSNGENNPILRQQAQRFFKIVDKALLAHPEKIEFVQQDFLEDSGLIQCLSGICLVAKFSPELTNKPELKTLTSFLTPFLPELESTFKAAELMFNYEISIDIPAQNDDFLKIKDLSLATLNQLKTHTPVRSNLLKYVFTRFLKGVLHNYVAALGKLVGSHLFEETVDNAYAILALANLVTRENLLLVNGKAEPESAAKNLIKYHHYGIDTPKNRELLGPDLQYDFVDALALLTVVNLKDEKSLSLIQNSAGPSCDAAELIFSLHFHHHLLDDIAYELIKKSNSPDAILRILDTVDDDMINHDFINQLQAALLDDSCIFSIQKFSSALHQNNALTQENFTKILRYAMQLNILATDHPRSVFDDVPPDLFTEAFFNHVLALIDEANRTEKDPAHCRVKIATVVNRYVRELVAPQINGDAQSTHTASVHASVSASAEKLLSHYGEKLADGKCKEILEKFGKELAKMKLNDLYTTAYQYFTSDQCKIVDPTSGITFKQLLAIAILIMEEKKASEQDANAVLSVILEALFEIEKAEGKRICPSGSLNKMMEKLCSIHPDVNIVFINPKIAGFKLPRIVNEKVQDFLNTKENFKTLAGLNQYFSRWAKLQEEGINFIWPAIKESVTNEMFDLFGSLYNDNKDPKFTSLIEQAQYANPEPAQKELLKSEGYRQYCSGLLLSSGLFAQSKMPNPGKDRALVKVEDASPSPKR